MDVRDLGTVRTLSRRNAAMLARALAAGPVPERLALPELPGTVGAVVGVDRVEHIYRCAAGRVELEYAPNLDTFDGVALREFMRVVALGGEALLEPERLAAALADALQAALDAVTLTVRVWYLDQVCAEARRGL